MGGSCKGGIDGKSKPFPFFFFFTSSILCFLLWGSYFFK